MRTIERDLVATLSKHLGRGPNLLQVVTGPRQVGKTTAVRQVVKAWKGPSHYASADLPAPPDASWVETQWEVARLEARRSRRKALLVLDEVQKIHRWAEVVKGQFDRDRAEGLGVRTVLLGSSSLSVGHGVEESLAGRYESHFCPHWSWPECRAALGWSLDQWFYFGGYPGAGQLARTPARWASHVVESLIEAVLSRDVLMMTHVAKPALLRQLFMLATRVPSQPLSYNKMLGQLQDAGNTVTLAHYLELLAAAFLVSGVNQFTAGVLRQRASSPKLVLWNNALITAPSGLSFAESKANPEWWGRLVENAVGAHLLNRRGPGVDVSTWRRGDDEVDFVVQRGPRVVAFEVKSGAKPRLESFGAFRTVAPTAKTLVVGTGGIPLDVFFSTEPDEWLR